MNNIQKAHAMGYKDGSTGKPPKIPVDYQHPTCLLARQAYMRGHMKGCHEAKPWVTVHPAVKG